MSSPAPADPSHGHPGNEQPPVTGHPAVDQALAELDLSGDVSEHVAAIDRAHATLQEVVNPSASAS